MFCRIHARRKRRDSLLELGSDRPSPRFTVLYRPTVGMVGFMDRERVPYSAVSEGSTLTITWSSMSGKGGDATGTVKRVSRGGVADSDGLNEFMLVTENGMRYKVYVDAGAYEGGRTNPPVERFTDAGVESLGSLTGIYEPED